MKKLINDVVEVAEQWRDYSLMTNGPVTTEYGEDYKVRCYFDHEQKDTTTMRTYASVCFDYAIASAHVELTFYEFKDHAQWHYIQFNVNHMESDLGRVLTKGKELLQSLQGELSGICSKCKDGAGFTWNPHDPKGPLALSLCCGAAPMEETLIQNFSDGRPYVHLG